MFKLIFSQNENKGRRGKVHLFGAYLGHPFKTTDLLFSKKKQTQTLILGPVKFPNCMWLFLDFLIPVWFKGFLNQQEQLSPWSQAWCVSLTVERTWIQGGAEVINGTSVTAQSMVALLCRGKLTAVIYLLSSATRTLKHTCRFYFCQASEMQECTRCSRACAWCCVCLGDAFLCLVLWASRGKIYKTQSLVLSLSLCHWQTFSHRREGKKEKGGKRQVNGSVLCTVF